jgi:hypothetical protein
MISPRRTLCKTGSNIEEDAADRNSPFILKAGSLQGRWQSKEAEKNQAQLAKEAERVCQQVRRETLEKTWAIGRLGIYSSHKGHLRIISSTAVSNEFKRAVDSFLKEISADLREIVRRKNTEILLLANAGELDPQLAALQAERHPGGGAMAYMPVFYEATLNAIIFSERLDALNQDGWQASQDLIFNPSLGVWGNDARTSLTLDRCASHEFGHAVDNALSHFALSKEFDYAFWQDFASITGEERTRLRHLITPDATIQDPQTARNAAKEEIFAELLALHQGLRKTVLDIDDLLKDRLPAMAKTINHKITHLFAR